MPGHETQHGVLWANGFGGGLRRAMIGVVVIGGLMVSGCDSGRADLLRPEVESPSPHQPPARVTVSDLIVDVDPSTGEVSTTGFSRPTGLRTAVEVVNHLLAVQTPFSCEGCNDGITGLHKLSITLVLNDATKTLSDLGAIIECLENCQVVFTFPPPFPLFTPQQASYTVNDPFTVAFNVDVPTNARFRVRLSITAEVHPA